MSLLITFEGGEGSGKTVQARTLYRRLLLASIPALLTREPGGTLAGEKITRLVKWAQGDISPLTELMLFNASRAQLVSDVLQPALKNGSIVICDRFADSTVAYQSYGRGLPLETVLAINKIATQGITPRITILLDIPVDVGLARKNKGKADRFHQEDMVFHRRVRQGYQQLARNEPERWLVIDATLSKNKIARVIWEQMELLLPLRTQGT